MYFLLIIGAFCWLPPLLISPGYVSILMATIGSCLIALAAFVLSLRLNREYIGYKAMCGFFLLQPIFFLAVVLLFPSDIVEFTANSGLFENRPTGLFVSFCLVPVMGLCFSLFLSVINPGNQVVRNLDFYMKIAGQSLNFILILAAVINLTIWVSTQYGGTITYFLRILHKSLWFSAFFAGLYFKQSRMVMLAWAWSLGIGLVLGMLSGSRGYAFYPLAFYGAGILVQACPGRERRFWVTLAAVSTPFLFILVGFSNGMRNEIGRLQLNEISFSKFIDSIGVVATKSLGSEDFEGKSAKDSALFSGTTRVVDWAAIYAPTMSPDPIRYRGYGDYLRELRGQFLFNIGSDGGARYYNSRDFARMYGFSVRFEGQYDGGVASTTVPFNILADSWSRFGLISSFIQISIAFAFFTVMEKVNRVVFRRNPELIVVGLMIIMTMSFNYITTYTLLEAMRGTVLQYTFTGLIFYCAQSLWKRVAL